MRVLVTWGTKLGGTAGIAHIIGDRLEHQGHDVDVIEARQVRDLACYEAAIIGGAVYANRWHRDARRFVLHHVKALRRIPVWLFSSGPLDDSADHATLPPPPQVATLAERIGAVGHVTFGGRLPANARGFPAHAMAKKLSGDWRNPERITAWADDIARQLADAHPRPAIDPPAHATWRLAAHAAIGWLGLTVLLAGALQVFATGAALAIHAIAAPVIFGALAVHYFRPRGAREPWPAAVATTGFVIAFDVLLGGLVLGTLDRFSSVTLTWLPFALILVTTWIVGLVRSTMPWPERPTGDPHAQPA